jgi:hypothetical protein
LKITTVRHRRKELSVAFNLGSVADKIRLMREVSPAVDVSVDEWVENQSPGLRSIVEEVRQQKQAGTRPRPSTTLVDRSALLTRERREKLLDAVAALVDENYVGRSEMCVQFAGLLHRALSHLRFPSRGVVGWAIYYDPNGREIHRWRHAWVRVGKEVIDANVDCLAENPSVPRTVSIAPYWGPITAVPIDRRLREKHGEVLPYDGDVDKVWWPELQRWIDEKMSR